MENVNKETEMRHMLVKIVAVAALAAFAIMTIASTSFAGGRVLAASASANVDESASLRLSDTSNPIGDPDSAASIKSWSGPPAIDMTHGGQSNEDDEEDGQGKRRVRRGDRNGD